MRVVQLQYKASSSGDFSKRLHDEFINSGIDSSILTLYSEVSETAVRKTLGRKARMISAIDNRLQNRLLRKADTKYGLFSYPLLGTDVTDLEQVKQADVIYLHWVLFGFLGFKHMEALAKTGKPIVFIMHDMWAITGGCHNSFGCEKYKTACSACKIFPKSAGFDFAASGFRRKQRFFEKYNNLYFVTPSKWLYDCAEQSTLLKDKPVFHIPNVLDQHKFKPIDKRAAKSILNIDPQEKVIAFGAVSIDSPYKGWEYLKSALNIFNNRGSFEKVSVLVFGGADNKLMADAIPFKIKFLDRITDEYAMSVVYNAADVFAAPSLADNLPYVIFEALACGTPVAAFNTGGIPDLIDHRNNGYLAKYKDAEDLANGISFCLGNEIKAQVLPEFETARTVQKHLDLCEAIKSSDN